jgi:predicted transcriptional regulator
MTERTKFYLLYSLFSTYEECKTDTIGVTKHLAPDGFVPHINIVFRLVGQNYQFTWEDASMVLPGLIRQGLVEEKESNREKWYKITYEGMLEYEKLAPKYPHTRIELAGKLIKELDDARNYKPAEATVAACPKVLEFLYNKYATTAKNSFEFSKNNNNYISPMTLLALMLVEDIKVNADIKLVLAHLQIEKLVESASDGKSLNYRISKKGIEAVEQNYRNATKNITDTNTLSPQMKSIPAAVIDPAKDGKIFISHADKDKTISQTFQDDILVTALGVSPKQIFNISVDASGIKSGEDFRKVIRTELLKSKAVILLITDNYKNSEACLNEMGAAWMLPDEIPVIPFILEPVTYDSVGFIHKPNQLLKLNQFEDLKKFVSNYKGELFTSNYNDSDLDRKINEFLEVVAKVKLPAIPIIKPAKKQKGKTSTVTIPTILLTAMDINDMGKALALSMDKDGVFKFYADKYGETPFQKINEHGGIGYFIKDKKLHEIPDIETQYFLGFKKYDRKFNSLNVKEEHLHELIGEPIESIFNARFVLCTGPVSHWLIVDGKRHELDEKELITKLSTIRQAERISFDGLKKFPQGNKFVMFS